jgi:hypothetical protein
MMQFLILKGIKEQRETASGMMHLLIFTVMAGQNQVAHYLQKCLGEIF